MEAMPSPIRDGASGFHAFHGGRAWSSLPSGQTMRVGVLRHDLPRWRPILAIPVVLVAGPHLGSACGTGVLAFPWERVGTRLATAP